MVLSLGLVVLSAVPICVLGSLNFLVWILASLGLISWHHSSLLI